MKYTSPNHKADIMKHVEKKYYKWLDKYEQKYEKENHIKYGNKSILKTGNIPYHDGYYLLKEYYDVKNNTEKFIKKMNKKINKHDSEFLYKYHDNKGNIQNNNKEIIKLVIPNNNEKLIPNNTEYYPLLEPPNVSILNQICSTTNIISHPFSRTNNNENRKINDANLNKPIMKKNIGNDKYDEKDIKNVLYIVKRPNTSNISEKNLNVEICNDSTIDTQCSIFSSEQLEENKNKHIQKINFTENNTENDSDYDCYLIPYHSLKTTIQACQNVNRNLTKLNKKNYPEIASTIYNNYTNLYDINKKYKSKPESSLNIKKTRKLPIKYILNSNKSLTLEDNVLLTRKESDEINNQNNDILTNDVDNPPMNKLYKSYYYNSVNDNQEKYQNEQSDIKPISLENLKYRTLFQKKNSNKSLIINDSNSKSNSKSINNIKSEFPFEENVLKPFHSLSSYSSILGSYPSYTLDEDLNYRRKLKQRAAKKTIDKKHHANTPDCVHISIFSLPYDKIQKAKILKMELQKNIAEVLPSDTPNPFKTLKIPRIQLPERRGKKKYRFGISDKGYYENIDYNPQEVEHCYVKMPEPNYGQEIFIKREEKKTKPKTNRNSSKGSKSLSTKSISFNNKIKVREIENSNDNFSEYSILSRKCLSPKSSSYIDINCENEDDEDNKDNNKSFKNNDEIEEQIVPPNHLKNSIDISNSKRILNDEDYSEYYSKSKSSSSFLYTNNEYSNKNSTQSLISDKNYNNNNNNNNNRNSNSNSIKTLEGKLHSLNKLSESSIEKQKSLQRVSSSEKYVQPSLSFNNLLKYDFVRRKRDEIKRLEYLCHNITKEQYEKKEHLNLFIRTNNN